jgi:hypothetical protein
MAEAEGLALVEKCFVHNVTLKKQVQRYKKMVNQQNKIDVSGLWEMGRSYFENKYCVF